MSSTSPFLSSVANSGVNRDQAREDQQLLDRLVKLWQSERTRGLEVRHKTGALLNQRLGPPTARQSHGRQVLKKVGEELQVAESELSRMRWLAHLFKDPADVRQGDPKIESWTQFKEKLPSLKPDRGEGARKLSSGSSRSVFKTLARSFQNMTSKLLCLVDRPEDADRALICECWQELAEAVSSRLKIPVRIVVDSEVPILDPVNDRAQRRPSESNDGRDAVSATTAVPS